MPSRSSGGARLRSTRTGRFVAGETDTAGQPVHRVVLGAQVGGWCAVCIDCPWIAKETTKDAAQASAEGHLDEAAPNWRTDGPVRIRGLT